MKLRWFLTFLSALCMAGVAAGQTKVSGKVHCGKPDDEHVIEIGDRADHTFAMDKTTCTWTTPWEIEGVKAKDDVVTGFSESSGGKFKERGYTVINMENGDKTTMSFQGSSTLSKDGTLTATGTWIGSSATGKFKGIKQKGTYTCKGNADGNDCDIEGEYTLAAK